MKNTSNDSRLPEERRRLPEVPYPRLNGLFRTAEKLWAERDDLRSFFPDIRSWKFWYWFMWHGTLEYEEVRKPPSNYRDAEFDAVYSYSVFSHLPEDLQKPWLQELHRILKPSGILVLTVQGRRVIAEYVAGMRKGDFPTAEMVREDETLIEETGFYFYPYSKLHPDIKKNKAHWNAMDLEGYGMTFILESYIRKNWLELFNLLAFHESPDEWQDYVVLLRR